MGPLTTWSLAPHQKLNPDIWANASTSWGIGLIVSDHWASWQLKEGWKSNGRDIGWVESIALEVAVLWAVHAGFHNVTIVCRYVVC